MIRNVYYLVHSATHERCFRYYETLAGARIAQRMRNSRLGYKTRVQRILDEDLGFEQCVNRPRCNGLHGMRIRVYVCENAQ